MRPGDVLDGRFVLEHAAASGGMGVVYRALDRATGGLAAVKALRLGAADLETRFLREAETLATLRHPAIVGYLAHGRSDDELYVAVHPRRQHRRDAVLQRAGAYGRVAGERGAHPRGRR